MRPLLSYILNSFYLIPNSTINLYFIFPFVLHKNRKIVESHHHIAVHAMNRKQDLTANIYLVFERVVQNPNSCLTWCKYFQVYFHLFLSTVLLNQVPFSSKEISHYFSYPVTFFKNMLYIRTNMVICFKRMFKFIFGVGFLTSSQL